MLEETVRTADPTRLSIAPEGRQMIAPGASLGNVDKRRFSPGRGERTTWRAGSSFQLVLSPLRGFGTLFRQPQACAWGYNLPPLRGYVPNSGPACGVERWNRAEER